MSDSSSLEQDLLADPACSYWLRERLRDTRQRDPVDALRDAQLLVDVLEQRCQHALIRGGSPD